MALVRLLPALHAGLSSGADVAPFRRPIRPSVSTRRMVCLAASRKPGGVCVAGREWNDGVAGDWLRPVGDRASGALRRGDTLCTDGQLAGVLDIIDLPVIARRLHPFQPENWNVDPGVGWVRAGRASWGDLGSMVDVGEGLWIDGHSTYHGRNDRLPEADAPRLGSSLKLIRVDDLRLNVFAPGAAFGSPALKVYASFEWNQVRYALRVTDPVAEHRFAGQAGKHSLSQCYLAISLCEAFKGACYKLVAAIITPARATPR